MGDSLDATDPVNGSDGKRAWAGARHTLLCGTAVAAVVLGALGVTEAAAADSARASAPLTSPSSPPDGPWAGGQKFSPPPAGPWPKGGLFTVAMCSKGDRWNNCDRRAITAEQKRALEMGLRATSQVTEVRFQSRQEALEEFLKPFAADDVIRSAVQAKDLPESFVGRLRSRADIAPFESAFAEMPGVAYVLAHGRDFWEGKADVSVTLCEKDCEGRGPATPQERKAFEDRLRGMRQVERVYVEDAAHARRVAAFRWGRAATRLPGLSEGYRAYHVKLVDPADARTVVGEFAALPGVGEARIVDTG